MNRLDVRRREICPRNFEATDWLDGEFTALRVSFAP